MIRPRLLAATAAASLAALALSGCVAKSDVAASGALTVTSTDTTCDVSAATATSGTLTFDVTNSSSDVSEFYLLASDGLRIVGEVENIAPGASRTLTVVAQPGDYYTLCKPGMVGEGVGKTAFAVSGETIAYLLQPEALWKVTWPLLLGAGAMLLLDRWPRRLGAIPEGDIVVLAQAGQPLLRSLSNRIGEIDIHLRRWPMAGLGLIALAILLGGALMLRT